MWRGDGRPGDELERCLPEVRWPSRMFSFTLDPVRFPQVRALIANSDGESTIRRWLRTPAPIWVIGPLAALILIAPAWLLWAELRDFWLWLDDFDYIGQSRDWPTAHAHLLEPHNAHVVPIFRLWTFVLVTLAGRLANLPFVLAFASYLGLVASMLAMGYVVARETSQAAAGLSAMAVLGLSTVSHPAVTWFSAGQALWAGTAILVTIALAQSSSEKRGAIRLAAVALATILAPAVWSGGLLAGPAAVAYLGFNKKRNRAAPALVLTAITIGSALFILSLSHGQIRAPKLSGKSAATSGRDLSRPFFTPRMLSSKRVSAETSVST